MKTKEIGRKLVLKKETVARLGDREMSKIYGGVTADCTQNCIISVAITAALSDPAFCTR